LRGETRGGVNLILGDTKRGGRDVDISLRGQRVQIKRDREENPYLSQQITDPSKKKGNSALMKGTLGLFYAGQRADIGGIERAWLFKKSRTSRRFGTSRTAALEKKAPKKSPTIARCGEVGFRRPEEKEFTEKVGGPGQT